MDEIALFEAARPETPTLTDGDRDRLWAQIIRGTASSDPATPTAEQGVLPLRLIGDDIGVFAHGDHATLHRHRDQRRARRLLTVAAALTAVVGGLGVWRTAGPSTTGQPSATSDSPATVPSSSTPATVPSSSTPATVNTAPLAWSKLATAEFALDGYSFIGSLPDGRAVLWNGIEATENITAPRTVGLAFYDAATDEWSRSSAFPGEQLWGNDAEIVGGSVIVHQYQGDGSRDLFARYDLAADTWTVTSDLPEGRIVLDWAADDTTIAAWTFQRNEPSRVLLRSTADGAWVPGAQAPFGERTQEGTARQGGRLAVYGGLSDSPTNAVPFPTDETGTVVLGLGDVRPYASLDGGIYDVSSDTWSTVPTSPLSGVAAPEVVLDGSTLVVAGGAPAGSGPGFVQQLGTFDATSGRWSVSAFDPTWRGGGVGVMSGALMAFDTSGYSVAVAPYDRWTRLPIDNLQNSWQPLPIGPNEYLHASHSDGVVGFTIIRDGVANEAPPVPWPTSPDTGYASAFIPTPDGVVVIDGVRHEPWLLSTR
jgi:hypothetical protein